MKVWLLAARPKTLPAAIVPILVGSALAKASFGGFHLWVIVFAVASAVCIQIATNILNDAIDFEKGTDREDRVGPIRVTQSKMADSKSVLRAGILFLVMALVFGIPLVIFGGWPIVFIGLVSLFFAYGYTGGPFPLSYLGLGDFFVFVFFGLVSVGGIYYLHSQSIHWDALVAGAQIGLLCTVLIAINNLRDIEQDKVSNKKTLAVRFGKTFARYEITALLVVTYCLSIYWAYTNFMSAALLSVLTIPYAIYIVKSVFSMEPSEKYNALLAHSAKLLLIFGLAISLGFLLEG